MKRNVAPELSPLPATAIAVCGIPASGKSTVARRLVKDVAGCRSLGTDELRGHLGLPFGDATATRVCYRVMAEKGVAYCRAGLVPVLDATFYREEFRAIVRHAFSEEAVQWLIIEVRTSIRLCRARVLARAKSRERVEGVNDLEQFDAIVRETAPCESAFLPANCWRVVVHGGWRSPRLVKRTAGVPARWEALLTKSFGAPAARGGR